jgi:hypothetical protein
MSLKKTSRAQHSSLNELNITPLLDLVFVLLVIFIITTPQMMNNLEMNLPSGKPPPPQKEKPKINRIVVDEKGQTFLNDQPSPSRSSRRFAANQIGQPGFERRRQGRGQRGLPEHDQRPGRPSATRHHQGRVPPLLHGLFTVQGDRPNTNSQARVLRKKNTMKNQNSRLQSRSEQSVVKQQSDFVRHCANRRLSTDKVLNYLRTRLPQQYGLAEVVGKWVWLDVSPARKPGLASLLWALGFHWNQRRGVWQHPCGKFQPVWHPSRRPARQVSLLFSSRCSILLKGQAP